MDPNTEMYLEKKLELERQKVEALLRIADALERLSPPTKKDSDSHQKLGFVHFFYSFHGTSPIAIKWLVPSGCRETKKATQLHN